MILMIDNYDSFTYNLVQYMGELGAEIRVDRNDKISIEEIEALKPQKIVISPGPCTPDEAGICLNLINELKTTFPILGICLGHQSIGQAFGGKIIKCNEIMHGKIDKMKHFIQEVISCAVFVANSVLIISQSVVAILKP